ncbi:hypothetical protein CLOM_g21136 [Closterium sp. NIES-68]|nr:hypothetical protein CLOM_g21136 [Closterium sp. NIES-68]
MPPRAADRKLANLAVKRLVSDILDAPCCDTDDYVSYLSHLSTSQSVPPASSRKRKTTVDSQGLSPAKQRGAGHSMDGLLHQVQRLKMTEQALASPLQASPLQASLLQGASLQSSPSDSSFANPGQATHDAEGSVTRLDSSPPTASHSQDPSTAPQQQEHSLGPTAAAVALAGRASVTPNVGSAVASAVESTVGSTVGLAGATRLTPPPPSSARRSLDLSGMSLNPHVATLESTQKPQSTAPPPPPGARRSLDLGGMSLNPHAVEFVPVSGTPPLPNALNTTSAAAAAAAAAGAGYAALLQGGAAGYAGAEEAFEECEEDLCRSQSHNSNASDDEYRRFWRNKLPDELLSFDDGMGMEMDIGGGGGGGGGGERRGDMHRSAISMPSLDSTHMPRNAAAPPPGGPDGGFDRQGYGYSFRQGVGPPAAQSMGNILEEIKSDSALDHLVGVGGTSHSLTGPGQYLPQRSPGNPLMGSPMARPRSSYDPSFDQPRGPSNPHLLPRNALSPAWRPSPGPPGFSPGPPPGGPPGSVGPVPSSPVIGHGVPPSPMGTPSRYPPYGAVNPNLNHMSPQQSPARGPPPYASPGGPLSRFGGSGNPVTSMSMPGAASPPPPLHHSFNSPARGYPPTNLDQRVMHPPPFELPGPAGAGNMGGRGGPGGGDSMWGGKGGVGGGMRERAMSMPVGWGPDEGVGGDDPVHILATEFPMFSISTLAEIFFSNGADLPRTMEILTQLLLQDEMTLPSPNHRRPLPPPSAHPPPLDSHDFPSLSPLDPLPSSSPMLRPRPSPQAPDMRPMQGSAPDFAGVLRKPLPPSAASQNAWGGLQAERSGGGEGGMGGAGRRGGGGEEGEGRGRGRGGGYEPAGRGGAQPWLETGNAVANLYGDMREEARDHARIRNACFEQATQAYLAGNKAAAKELSARGQWHNEQMKAAHAKASDAIFRTRNAASGYLSGGPGDGGEARVLDLHGLHVGEAIPMLKREIAAMRNAARSTQQRQQVYVCVGTGHHTKGRAPLRLPLAVERYLVEEERLQFMETQPGMLRVLV